MEYHPKRDDKGQRVPIREPHAPSAPRTWEDPLEVAIAIPGGPLPGRFTENTPAAGLPRWPAPVEDPPFDRMGLEPAAGAVVVEPDGRVWLVAPTNAWAGTRITFPKGRTDGGGLQETAIREAREEAGLEVELLEHLVDVSRTTTRTRYYIARRRSGDPAGMGWESQAVLLAPAEKLREIQDRPEDREVLAALEARWSSWAGWFRKDPSPRDLEAARSGEIPARREHWPTLPLPARRVSIPLDVKVDAAGAANIRLGFVPRMMEQKGFAWFEDGVLHEHRSWTGICVSEVHFVPEGEGLRATHAFVNRYPAQYACTDDAEDARALAGRIGSLAGLTWEDRHAVDPFVEALMGSLVPGYLGSPSVVDGLLEPWLNLLVERQYRRWSHKATAPLTREIDEGILRLAKVFSGGDPAFKPIGDWNTAPKLGAALGAGLGFPVQEPVEAPLAPILEAAFRTFVAWFESRARDLYEDSDEESGPIEETAVRGGMFLRALLLGTHTLAFPGKTLWNLD